MNADLSEVELAICQTVARLHEFETQYELSTDDFLLRYAENELPETLDLDEWIGEARLLERLQQKLEALKGIECAG